MTTPLDPDLATEAFQLLDRMLGDEAVKAQAARYAVGFKRNQYRPERETMARAYQAGRVSDLLAGLLSGLKVGEPAITEDGLRWLVSRARDRLAEVERARQPTEPSNATSSPKS